MNHRFVIGIGSQRAGSTLLHGLLADASDVFMHPLKELHYFDTFHGLRTPKALADFSLRQLARETHRIAGAEGFGFVDKAYRCYLRTNAILATTPVNSVSYIDLFRPCLRNRSLLGEVTPEYMLLRDAALQHMRTQVGADAVIILVCRNPVKRVLSAMKLLNSYNAMKMDNAQADAWLNRMLRDETPWMKAQDGYNDYTGAIEQYRCHFERVVVFSYDELVTAPENIARMIQSVGEFPVDEERFKAGILTEVNALGEDFQIEPQTLAMLNDRYAERHHKVCEYLSGGLVL